MWACQHGHKNVVKLLLDNSERIELNAKNIFGRTAFMLTCSNGHMDVVKMLLDHSNKIELNARDNIEMTAFIDACFFRHKDVVKLLLEYSEVVEINIPESLYLFEDTKNMIELHSMRDQNWNKYPIFEFYTFLSLLKLFKHCVRYQFLFKKVDDCWQNLFHWYEFLDKIWTFGIVLFNVCLDNSLFH